MIYQKIFQNLIFHLLHNLLLMLNLNNSLYIYFGPIWPEVTISYTKRRGSHIDISNSFLHQSR